MATDAQGRLLSEDGNYYWDGSDWQLADTAADSGSQQSDAGSYDAQGRLLSEDGNYYWDGSDWQLVDTTAGSGGGDAQQSSQQSQTDDFVQAMSSAGYAIDASVVPEASVLGAALNAALEFLQSGDQNVQSAMSTVSSAAGTDTAIALSAAGVVSGIDDFLRALDLLPVDLETLLQAALQALQTAQQSGQ
ncbi:MAG TPA: hypothetical protein VGS97_10970 [Actinocrinis sp.]|uniref:hypothetical protein n=1 Tax=Actinocrinis sp. TaxID=1920516 RepID=UPI002DDD0282|nr:hypothetical protein [Actinocrinis sp.]HEV2344605.1 hypothetical protein [Actinocrinis sp.]